MTRESNKVVHKLAQYMWCISDNVVWMEIILLPLFPFVLDDIAEFS